MTKTDHQRWCEETCKWLERTQPRAGFHWIAGGTRTDPHGRLVEHGLHPDNPADYIFESTHQFMLVKND